MIFCHNLLSFQHDIQYIVKPDSIGTVMFKRNTKHSQTNMFGLFSSLSAAQQKKAINSEEYHFYNLIFRNIKEENLALLYSDQKSRPNAPVNALLSAIILMHRYGWTYAELFKHMEFNILTKFALGIDSMEEMPFCPATLFNFQNRLNDHLINTGENLLEQVFDSLTQQQLKTLKIKTDIQRTDSFQAASNIRSYSRLQLLVELVIRIFRILSDEDKDKFREHFQNYIKKSSGQYIYSLKASDVPHEIEEIGTLYHWINQNLSESYKECDIFKTFLRVFSEHFTVVEEKVEVKDPSQLTSGCVQSPDDLDATYREKSGKKNRGQVVNVVETANPENKLNLITDVAVKPNNTDDSRILNERLDQLKEKTSALNELHFDGAYPSSENDAKCAEHDITAVQTGVKGRKPAVELSIEQISDDSYVVSCPNQQVNSSPSRKRHKACFDLNVCSQCPHQEICSTTAMKTKRVYYFTHEGFQKRKRIKAIEELPPNRQKLRHNVEATVKEFTHRMPNGKLKVRGAFKAACFAYMTAVAINFGRIYRYQKADPKGFFYFFVRICQRTFFWDEKSIFILRIESFFKFLRRPTLAGAF